MRWRELSFLFISSIGSVIFPFIYRDKGDTLAQQRGHKKVEMEKRESTTTYNFPIRSPFIVLVGIADRLLAAALQSKVRGRGFFWVPLARWTFGIFAEAHYDDSAACYQMWAEGHPLREREREAGEWQLGRRCGFGAQRNLILSSLGIPSRPLICAICQDYKKARPQ